MRGSSPRMTGRGKCESQSGRVQSVYVCCDAACRISRAGKELRRLRSQRRVSPRSRWLRAESRPTSSCVSRCARAGSEARLQGQARSAGERQTPVLFPQPLPPAGHDRWAWWVAPSWRRSFVASVVRSPGRQRAARQWAANAPPCPQPVGTSRPGGKRLPTRCSTPIACSSLIGRGRRLP
jgi:hypothetical protein